MRILAVIICLGTVSAGPSFGFDGYPGGNNKEINNNGNFNGHNNGHNNGYNSGYNNGYNNGHTNGYNHGHNNGYNNGHNNGYNHGHNNGYNNGNNNGYNDRNNNGNYGVYGYRIPEFLKSLQPQTAMEFMKLTMNTSKPISEVENLQADFARKYGFESQYREYLSIYQRQKTEFFSSVKQLAGKLASFFDKSKNIVDNKSNSYAAMQKQIYDLLRSLQPPQQKIVRSVIRVYGGDNHLPLHPSGNPGTYPGGNGVYPGNGANPNSWNDGNQWGNGGRPSTNGPIYPPNPNGGGHSGGNGWQPNGPGYPQGLGYPGGSSNSGNNWPGNGGGNGGFPNPYPYPHGGNHGNNGMNLGQGGFNDPYGNHGRRREHRRP